MALKLDPFAQRRLLELAATDQAISAASHRRANLPALTTIRESGEQAAIARRAVVVSETEVGDLQRATNKLDAEVDQVRARARRDAQRLESGQATPKELESLQHEIESLRRRQRTLEDEELELMEQRENAEGALKAARAILSGLDGTIRSAEAERDREFAVLDEQLSKEQTTRAGLTAGLPADVLALYTRIKDSGKVAAGALLGVRCGACRLDIDRTALSGIPGTNSSPRRKRKDRAHDRAEGVTSLLIVRHGETELGVSGQYAGQLNTALTPQGRRQARQVAHRLMGLRPDVVVTSPLDRCRVTAEAIATAARRRASAECPVISDVRLTDQALGEWTGCTAADIAERWPAEFTRWRGDAAAAPPGGESLQDLLTRSQPAIADAVAAHVGRSVVVVSHAAPIRALLTWVLGTSIEVAYRLRIDNASVSGVLIDPDGGRTAWTINETGHLLG